MRTPYWLATIFLALAIGTGIGLLIAPSNEAPVAPPAASGDPEMQQGSRDSVQGESQLQPAANEPSPRPEPEPAAPEPGPEFQEVEIPALPSGDGIVTVKVVDQDGQPVEGFEVTATQFFESKLNPHPVRADYASEDDFILAQVRHTYVRLKLAQKAKRTLASDAAGKIEFTGIIGESCQLSARSGRYLIGGRFATMSVPGRVGEEFLLEVTRACAVKLTVACDSADKPKNCRVKWTTPDGSRSDDLPVICNAEQEIFVIPGTYNFSARSESPLMQSDEQLVTIDKDGVSVALNLQGTKLLRGTVTFPDARPQRWSVRAARVVAGATDEELMRESRGAYHITLEVDEATGRYTAESELQGEYLVYVTQGYRETLAGRRVNLDLGDPVVDFEVRPAEDAVSCSVTIETDERIASKDMQFTVRDLGEKPRNPRVEVWVHDDKRYLLVLGEDKDTPVPADASLIVTNPGLGSVVTPYRPTADRQLTIKFEAPALVSLNVTGMPAGAVHPRITVKRVGESEGSAVAYWRDRAQVSLQPGKYMFAVLERDWPWPWLEMEVELESGKRTIELKVPSTHSVKLDGSGCSPYSHAKLTKLGTEHHLVFGDDGVAILTQLPAGDYEVSYTANGIYGKQRTQKFTLPGPEVVVLTGE